MSTLINFILTLEYAIGMLATLTIPFGTEFLGLFLSLTNCVLIVSLSYLDYYQEIAVRRT